MHRRKTEADNVNKGAKRPSSLRTNSTTLERVVTEKRSTPEGGFGDTVNLDKKTGNAAATQEQVSEIQVTDGASASSLCNVTSHNDTAAVKTSSIDPHYMQQEAATFIEVIKDLTPSFTYKEPSSYPLLPRNSLPDSLSKVTSSRRSSSDAAAPGGRQRTTSERSSLTTSSTSQYQSDSGYDTGDRNSNYQSLETSHEENYNTPQEKITRCVENRDELVSNLLQGITTLTEKAQQESVHCSSPEGVAPADLPPLSWDKPGTKTNAVFDIELRHSIDGGSDYKSFTSPQGSPATPRRFKSPHCIRTEGVDFEEKWTFFEIITSPPEEFRDMLPSKSSTKTSPDHTNPNLCSPKNSPCHFVDKSNSLDKQTSSCMRGSGGSHGKPGVTSKTSSAIERKEKVLANSLSRHGCVEDSNSNLAEGSALPPASVKASTLPMRRPYRAVRKTHRPKQNAQTNTETATSTVISIEAGSHNVTKPKLRSPQPELSTNSDYESITAELSTQDSLTSNLDKPDGNTCSSPGNPFTANSQHTSEKNTIQTTCGKTGGSKITSPILKRLFSTTMSRGLQVTYCTYQ